MVRDSVSAAYLRSIGRPADVVTTDVVFALPVPEVQKSRDVVLNVSGLLWHPNPHVDSAAYRSTITDLIGRLLADGRRVTLLAHVLDSSNSIDNDSVALREIERAVDQDIEVCTPSGLDEVREVVASANVVIGARMHACLNALSVGTPAIPLAYSRKFAPLLGDLGWGHTIDLRTDSDPVERILDLTRADLAGEAGETAERARDALRSAEDGLRAVIEDRIRR
jgi:colanic acid/amylovoran biosynthesis protein